MDRHVAEQPTRDTQILERRWGWVSAHDGQLFEAPNVASGDPFVYLAKRWIETPIEADHDGRVQRSDLCPAPIDSGQVQVDRFLAEHCLPGAYGAGQQVDVGWCGRSDHNCVDARVLHCGINRGSRAGAVLLGHFLRSRVDRVVHPGQLGPGMNIDRVGVYASDASAAQEGETDQPLLLPSSSCASSVSSSPPAICRVSSSSATSERFLSSTAWPSFKMMKWLPTRYAWCGLWVMNTTPSPASR